MFKKLLVSTAIAALTALPATAGSLAEPVVEPAATAPVVVAGTDWTGFYAGVQGNILVAPAPTDWGGGVHAGYLYDMGNFVVGGEANYTYLTAPSHRVGAEAILGYDAGDFLPLVTAGGAWHDTNDFGWSAGAGAAVMATDSVMLNGRYRYTYYPTPAVSTHEVLVGVSLRF